MDSEGNRLIFGICDVFGYLGLGFKVRACNVAVTILNPGDNLNYSPGPNFRAEAEFLIA